MKHVLFPARNAIDAWVNVKMGSGEKPEWLKRVAADYFNRPEQIFVDITPESLIADMDELGVGQAILATRSEAPDPDITAFCDKYPERFALSVTVDPDNGMQAVRALESIKNDHPVVLARVVPFMLNMAPNEAAYYPIYAKCVELDLPISVNTGIPGPPAPGRVHDPLYLDEVCLFFPDLKLVMAHGADPWWNVAIRLMLKYKNLHLMTSAFAPKYFPRELLQFMNTRGKNKIIFASDHPVLSMERCMREALQLDLREGVLEAFLHDNAAKLFFGKETR